MSDVLTAIEDRLPVMTKAQRATAVAAVERMLAATPAKGGDRVAVLRDLGWRQGVCYKLDTQLVIAAWSAIGKHEELWATMPRRGRPTNAARAAKLAAAAAAAA